MTAELDHDKLAVLRPHLAPALAAWTVAEFIRRFATAR